MKILVTGVGGQLGHDVMNELIGRGHTGVGSDIAPEYSGVADGSAVTTAEYVPMDITDAAQVSEVITKVSPDVVIHCAAWTAVDAAEDDDKKAKVKAINADGTQNIANVCKQLDCKMVYISTDYVFDGQGETPWEPDCKDYKPLNVYGETKLAGELAVSNTLDKYFIVRIAWVFGVNGKNFIHGRDVDAFIEEVDDEEDAKLPFCETFPRCISFCCRCICIECEGRYAVLIEVVCHEMRVLLRDTETECFHIANVCGVAKEGVSDGAGALAGQYAFCGVETF